jgi:small subunit ribosomal protein S5
MENQKKTNKLKKEKPKATIGKSKKRSTIKLSKKKYKEKILQVKRVTKVVKGGKKLSFRAVVVVGDGKRKVGVGIGKASDVSLAIEKSILDAKKNFINIPLTHSSSIPGSSSANLGASTIILRPAARGTGVIAGGSVRTVLELGGIKNILGKQLGSKNLLNNAKATIKALSEIEQKIEVSKYQSRKNRLFYQKLMKKLVQQFNEN